MGVTWRVELTCASCSAHIVYENERPPWEGAGPFRFVVCPSCGERVSPQAAFQQEASRPAPPAGAGDAKGDLMAMLSPSERDTVTGIMEDEALSEVDKLWSITDALFGGEPSPPPA